MPSAPDPEIIPTDDLSRGSSGSFSDGEDMFLTIDTLDADDFPAVERPRALVKKESLQKEKQVSVDPMSLMGPTIRQANFTLVSTPPRAPRSPGKGWIPRSPGKSPASPLPPPKLKFVSASLPGSASSSPRSRLSLSKKPWDGHSMASPECPQPHQHWVMDDADLALQEINMRKSRSEGEGRASISADDFNVILERQSTGRTKYDQINSFPKPGSNYEDRQLSSGRQSDVPEDGFKCGKLCLFLPRGGKGKAVRASSSNSSSSIASRMTSIPSHKAESMMPPRHSHKAERAPSIPSHKTEQFSPARSLKMDLPVISRRVSLERFDLGSISSSAMSDEEEGEPTSLFFDLPLEMIRYSVSEMQSPVTAAFVFDKDINMERDPKGVLKKASQSADERRSLSQDPSRHVLFSTSSAKSSPLSPLSPRRKDRDFTTFLEAQNT